MKKTLLLLNLLLGIVSCMYAQVTSVNYQIIYNESSCQYDALLIINAGSATTVPQRIQFNAQYSIVVPTGNALTVTESYLPFQSNAAYTGTIPIDWEAGAPTVAPAAQPGSDFYSITPDLGITSHYNDLFAGDTLKLFSFVTDTIYNCSVGIRIYENGIDPSSTSPGMGSADYSNGFTLGSVTQIYSANSTQLYPSEPEIVAISNLCSEGIEIDLTAETSSCQMPMTYFWTGPSEYISTDEDVFIPNSVDSINNGLYKVVVSDAFGCKDSISISATSKPNAGPDLMACPESTITIYGTSPTTGTWAQSGSNSFGISLNPLAGGATEVTFSEFALETTYDLVYSIPGCSDTMTFTVLPNTDPFCLVGTEDLIANNIKVYPNPASDYFYIEGESAIEAVSILTLSHQKIRAIEIPKGSRKIQIATEKLNRGLYILAIKSEGKEIFKKLVID